MDYITVKEAAAKWGFAVRSIQNYCSGEKIPGAKCIGGQWFIPADAKPPIDGRLKTARERRRIEDYKFPVFIYTRYYAEPSALNEEERQLLQAQIMHLEGNHMQSIILCNQLLQENLPSYLKAGVYLTIGMDSFILGLVYKFNDAVLNLERLAAREVNHKEDYRLIAAALKFYVQWNSTGLMELQPSMISSEAAWYYQVMMLSVAVLSANMIPTYFLRYLESECLIFEKEGIIPLLYLYFCSLGILNDLDRTEKEKEMLLMRGIELAVEHHWVHNLHRFYNFCPEKMEKIVKAHGSTYLSDLRKAHKTSISNWNIFHSKETGFDVVGTFTPTYFELLILITYGYTEKEIALCVGLTENDTKKKINEMMEITHTKNLGQLRAYVKKAFFSSTDESE